MKVDLTKDECSTIRYALAELGNRRLGQSIEFSGAMAKSAEIEARNIRLLTERFTFIEPKTIQHPEIVP